jgi:hypothetical protein
VDPAKTQTKRSAERTQEVAAVDILEEEPIGYDIPVDVELAPVPHGPESISPLSVSLPSPRRPADSTFKIEALRRPRRRLGAIVTGAMGLSVCILLVAGVRARMTDPSDPQALALGAALQPVGHVATPPPSQPWRSSASATPTTPMSGTITSKAGALFVDGARISAKSAVVACGRHQLKTGRGKARDVDVPCGGTLLVDRSGKTTVQIAH